MDRITTCIESSRVPEGSAHGARVAGISVALLLLLLRPLLRPLPLLRTLPLPLPLPPLLHFLFFVELDALPFEKWRCRPPSAAVLHRVLQTLGE